MADNQNEQPARPPRSLRDRRHLSNTDLPPTDYINTEAREEIREKPDDFDQQAQNYLSRFEEDEEDEPDNIPVVEPDKKPKVQVLNVREKRISTEEAKKATKEKIKEEVDKVKDELQKVEEVVEDTKEELNKIGNKISENAAIYKAKIIEFSLKAADFLLTVPKDFIMRMVFRRKTAGKPKKEDNKQGEVKEKVIPKVKYSSLLAKKIEFLAYDKKPLAEGSDTGILLEQIFMSNTIADVQFCIKYVTDLPIPDKGIYKGRRITEIFENVTSEDINRFLYYVQTNPDPFIGSNYKFSEAFATWIIRKSHEQ
jgi:hypothetical protein